MAYINSYGGAKYSTRPFGNYGGGPMGQSLLSLYKPYFSGQPYGMQSPGGGFQQPNLLNPAYREVAPTFVGAVPGIRGTGGASTLGGGGVTAKNTGVAVPKGGMGGGDPILAKAKAFAEDANSAALAAAIAAKKQDLIRFGDPDLVNRVLGGRIRVYGRNHPELAGQDKTGKQGQNLYKYADVQKATANSPFSTVKELDRWNTRQGTGINEQRNKQGLFYSSTRARDQGLQGEDFLRQKTKAYNDFQDAISAIEQALIAQQMNIRQGLLGAEESSYNRQQAQAAAGG